VAERVATFGNYFKIFLIIKGDEGVKKLLIRAIREKA
jgi:hypothetical protein